MAADGIEVNTIAFEGAMQRLKAGVRAGLIHPSFGTIPVQARLLAQRCQKLTPPDNQSQGYVTVTSDITRIYFPQSPNTYRTKSLNKIIRNDDRVAWNAAAEKFGTSHGLRGTTAIGFSPTLHRENRTRVGRVRRAKYGNIGFVTLGPEAVKVRNYIKEVKKRVGWAKGGWNAGAMLVGAGGKPPPQWVTRHGTSGGYIIDDTAGPDPSITIGNRTSWAKNSSSNAERVIRMAIAGRIRDMENYAEGKCRDAAASAMAGENILKSRGGFGGGQSQAAA